MAQPEAPEKELTLIGHLDELRMRLIICVSALLLSTFGLFFVAEPVLEILIMPVQLAPGVESLDEDKSDPKNSVSLVVSDDGVVRVERPTELANLDKLDALVLVFAAVDDDKPTTRRLALGGGRKIGPRVNYTSPLDPIMMQMKVALILGILVSLIVWVWQIWLFVAPGLTDKEKSVVRPLLVGAIVSFPVGALFAYALCFVIVRAMLEWAVADVEMLYSMKEYLKILTSMMIAFGFIFELPLVVAMLARVGLLTPAFLRHYRRHIYVVLGILSMLLTPADPLSMILALIPLIALFEVSIFVAGPMAKMHQSNMDDDGEEATS